MISLFTTYVITALIVDGISTIGFIMAIIVPAFIATPMIALHGKSILRISKLEEEMRELATKDTLTGVYSRYFILEFADELVKLSEREHKHISLLYCDIDYFKKINDTYGHVIGDYVLTETASRLKFALRKSDLIGRVGGGEFVVILPDTDTDSAIMISEKIRKVVSEKSFICGTHKIDLTVSIGICSTSESSEFDRDFLIDKADKSLYQSKLNGRNRITTYTSTAKEE